MDEGRPTGQVADLLFQERHNEDLNEAMELEKTKADTANHRMAQRCSHPNPQNLWMSMGLCRCG